jgi:hypothetical protein
MKPLQCKLLMTVVALANVLGGCGGASERARAHSIVQTRMELNNIRSALYRLSFQSPGLWSSNFSNLDSRALYDLVTMTNFEGRTIPPHSGWDKSHDLVDTWGRPFRVVAWVAPNNTNSPTSKIIENVRIWSLGPNGRDENGAGDDIAISPVQIQVSQ